MKSSAPSLLLPTRALLTGKHDVQLAKWDDTRKDARHGSCYEQSHPRDGSNSICGGRRNPLCLPSFRKNSGLRRFDAAGPSAQVARETAERASAILTNGCMKKRDLRDMARELLEKALAAHGGLARWSCFATVQATIVTGGQLFGMKGTPQDPMPRRMTVATQREWASVCPYGADDQRTDFTANRIAIEKFNGIVVKERVHPSEHAEGQVGRCSLGRSRSSLLQRLCSLDIPDDAVPLCDARFRR